MIYNIGLLVSWLSSSFEQELGADFNIALASCRLSQSIALLPLRFQLDVALTKSEALVSMLK